MKSDSYIKWMDQKLVLELWNAHFTANTVEVQTEISMDNVPKSLDMPGILGRRVEINLHNEKQSDHNLLYEGIICMAVNLDSVSNIASLVLSKQLS